MARNAPCAVRSQPRVLSMFGLNIRQHGQQAADGGFGHVVHYADHAVHCIMLGDQVLIHVLIDEVQVRKEIAIGNLQSSGACR